MGVNSWLTSNRLKRNKDKTQFILGTHQQLTKICNSTCLNKIDIPLSSQVTRLEVIIESELEFDIHIRRLASKCFYQLPLLLSVRRSLTVTSARSLVHAFMVCCIDYYCNGVRNGISTGHPHQLQCAFMNAVARMIVQRFKCDPITAIIRDNLNWLPVILGI